MRHRASPVLAALAAVAASLPASTQEAVHIDGLGTLSFPNSGAPEAQEPFLRGVLLMHSFEYAEAAAAFRRAQQIDPDFALAYWGEAMTYTHPVWNEKDPEAARSALERLAPSRAERLAKAPTEREKGYLSAVETLYADGAKARLDTLYSAEMARLAERYPDDHEARAFHALSLLGLSQGDRDVPTYMEAGAVALDLFDENPDHPVAAHYAIHSFDDPTHAILAMEAARAYGPIAPEAAHAQHMTTHIFLARGMWDEVVEANVRADVVVDRARAERGQPPTWCGHYNQWLLYGYLQQGREADARALLHGCLDQALEGAAPRGPLAPVFGALLQRNLYLVDSGDAEGAAARLRIDADLESVPSLLYHWGSGVAALGRGDPASAEAHHAWVEEGVGGVPASYVSPYAPVWEGTLRAMLLADRGELDEAVAAAHEAAEFEAALPVDFGPPIAFKPARELEGELLLANGDPAAAMAAFRLALGRTPNRRLALLGFARAAAAAGHRDVAAEAYRALLDVLHAADAGHAEVAEARAFLESTEPSGPA